MGQYHNLVCLETRSAVDPHAVGAGSKAAEQVWSQTTLPSAFALLCACNDGQHERDIPWAPHGAWAGKTPMNFGDYAEDGDTYGRSLPAPESKIRHMITEKQRPLQHRNSTAKSFSDVSAAIRPVLERVHNHRYFGLDVDGKEVCHVGWAEMVPVRKDAKDPNQWCMDLSETPVEQHKNVLDYYERIGITKSDCWRRPPMDIKLCGKRAAKLSPAPDEIAGPAQGIGEPLLWVNLDRGEFVDPALIGDTPDLAGIMNGLSPSAVLAMLYHHNPRGGGDIGSEGSLSISGRWRGDRIALIGAKGIKVEGLPKVTQQTARANFTDISNNALCFVDPEKVFGTENLTSTHSMMNAPETALQGGSDPFLKVLKLALESKPVSDLCAEHGKEVIKQMRAIFVPPLKVTKDIKDQPLSAPLHLAPRFELLLARGKVCLDQDTYLQISNLLKDLQPEEPVLTEAPHKRYAEVSLDPVKVITTGGMSNHVLINIMPDVAA